MAKPDPKDGAHASGPEQTYFRHLQAGAWRVPKCRGCGALVFYPRVLCLECGADAFDWIEPAGSGTIYSITVMHRPAEAGGDRNLCLIDLDEGFRMMSEVESDDPAAPKIGDRVHAKLRKEGDSHLVVFVPAEVRA